MIWNFTIRDKYGKVKSSTRHKNLVTNEGAGDYLDQYLSGSGYSASWFLGLCFTPMTPAKTDTAAKITTGNPNPPTTNDWSEATAYLESTRQAVVFGVPTAGGGDAQLDNTASPAVFTPTGPGTLVGGFMASVSGKDSTSGILYAVNNSAGNLSFLLGDTIEVTVEPQLTPVVG